MQLDKVTVAIVLKTGKVWLNKKGEYPIKLRVTYRGKQKFYTVKGESATKEEFAEIIKIKSKGLRGERRVKFNAIERRANEVIEQMTEFTFDEFENQYLNYNKQEVKTIHNYFETKAKELENDNKLQTATLYKATIKSLLEFDNKIDLKKITPKYLKNYEKWMIEQGKTYTTIGMYMRNLKHILNRALTDKVITVYPFGTGKEQYQIPKSTNTKKALNIADIEKLVSYKPDNINEQIALQYWVFSYLCNGMNMVDIANLKYRNIKDNSLRFIRQKTKDTTAQKTEIDVYLLDEAWSIINSLGNADKSPENYIFPILKEGLTPKEVLNRVKQFIKNTNKYIKRVALKADIDTNITTYWARHSYSTILKRSGAPIEFISEQLGHQTTRVTASYLDSFEDEQKKKYSANLLNFKK